MTGEDRLVFEREFEPGEEYTAVYGVQDEAPGDIDRFLTEPTVETGPATERSGPDDGHGEPGASADTGSSDIVDPDLHPIEVERGGVTVEKFFEPDEFPVPAIAFVVRSERDGPAEVRLVEGIPDEIPIEDIGLHPEYGAECWTVTGEDRLVFEREFEPGEEYTTVYGVRADDPSDIERLLTEPSIEGVGEGQRESGSADTRDSDPAVAATDGAEVAADGEDPSGVGADGGSATTAAGDDPSAEHAGGPRADSDGAGTFDDGPVTGSEEYTDSIDASYDEFEHVEPLGGGGFADVRLATYEGREVALKEPRFGTDATLSTDLVDRFVEEAEYWTAVDDHPNVVTVLDHGLHGGLPWLALEYVPDGDLSTVVGDLSVTEAAAVGVGIARAVRHAHRHSVSHLDLKPGNVLLDATGGVPTPKVTDWGLSRTLLDETGTMEGLSIAYAAPEQFEGGSPDDFTDIYQLGALLFELFTGDPPYDGPPMAVLREKGDEPPQPTAVDPSLPDAVDDIVGRAMAAAKTDRYETVVDLRRDLAGVRERS